MLTNINKQLSQAFCYNIEMCGIGMVSDSDDEMSTGISSTKKISSVVANVTHDFFHVCAF